MAYQYETSPRKIEPDYDYGKKQKITKSNTTKTKINKRQKTKIKRKLKPNVKAVLYVLIGFSVLFAISYRNSLITLTFNEKEALKAEISEIEKQNEQLKVNIETSLNLNNVEQAAKEKLGMQKLDNSQKKYITIKKEDYVEPATEEILIEEDTDWFTDLIESIFGN